MDQITVLLIANLVVTVGVGLSHLIDKLSGMSMSGVRKLHVGVCSRCFEIDISRGSPGGGTPEPTHPGDPNR